MTATGSQVRENGYDIQRPRVSRSTNMVAMDVRAVYSIKRVRAVAQWPSSRFLATGYILGTAPQVALRH